MVEGSLLTLCPTPGSTQCCPVFGPPGKDDLSLHTGSKGTAALALRAALGGDSDWGDSEEAASAVPSGHPFCCHRMVDDHGPEGMWQGLRKALGTSSLCNVIKAPLGTPPIIPRVTTETCSSPGRMKLAWTDRAV